MKGKSGTVAVIGSASGNISDDLKDLSMDVGKVIIDLGFLLVNGGMGGVMRYSAKGAQSSKHYSFGCTVGVLPSYDKSDSNEYIDIPIPTGLGVARNTIVVAMSDVVIALDGGAGTLSELAIAWQMNKTVICIGDRGWHTRIDSMELDSRERAAVIVVENINELAGVIQMLPEPSTFMGIKQSGGQGIF